MEKIHKTIFINASPEKVWKTMLDDATYREWTSAFSPGSRYEGSWEKGSKILFLGPNPDGGGEMGMVSRIAECRPYEFVSIEHLGIVKDGVEDTESEEARRWSPAFENYAFDAKDGGTELSVDQDIDEENKASFEDLWDKALAKLKELAER